MSFFAPRQGHSGGEATTGWRIIRGRVPYFDDFSVHHHDGYEFFLHVCNGTYYQLGQQVFPLQDYQLLVREAESGRERYQQTRQQGYDFRSALCSNPFLSCCAINIALNCCLGGRLGFCC